MEGGKERRGGEGLDAVQVSFFVSTGVYMKICVLRAPPQHTGTDSQ